MNFHIRTLYVTLYYRDVRPRYYIIRIRPGINLKSPTVTLFNYRRYMYVRGIDPA